MPTTYNPFSSDFWTEKNWWGDDPNKYKMTVGEYSPDRRAFNPTQRQRDLSDLMWRQASGQGPSVAEMQMQRGLGRALQGSQAMAASAPGMSPGLAQRLAMQRAGEMQGQTNMDMGMLRAQEQAQARGEMQNYLAQQQQAQMALEQMRAQQRMAANQLNMQQSLQQQGMAAADQGIWGGLTNMSSQALAAYANMPYGGAGGGSAGNSIATTRNSMGGYGPPQWSDYFGTM